ncbi:MAG TPA: D-aminoacylase [Candidatus Binataceae bacterium]|jgi:N-acyl-D-aspartate/D-glutamate deacylase|nr:D-aminoacylase [Candidatus Binataceae bacterium]
MQYDLLIKGGTIYDGSGAPGFEGDVAVAGDRIVAVGKVRGNSRRTIDAKGMAVAPGFIDPHSHYDGQLFWDPLITSSSWHGVTTVLTGNCGVAFAPCKPEQREIFKYLFSRVEGVPATLLQKAVPWDWENFGEFLDSVERRRPALNVACLMGQSAIRAYVMGEEAMTRREATRDEIERMKAAVRQGMRAGAAGLSASRFGLHVGDHGEPMPGKITSNAEMYELFDAVGESRRGLFEFATSHIASGDDPEKERRQDWELVEAARRTGLVSTWGGILQRYAEPGKWREWIEMNEKVWRSGLRVYPQAACQLGTPYVFSMERPELVFDDLPHWKPIVFSSSLEERKRMYRDPEIRKGLRYDVVEDPLPRYFHKRWDLMIVKQTALAKNRGLEGKSIAQIAKETGKDVFDTFLDLSLEEDLKTVFSFKTINGEENEVLEIMTYPHMLVSLADGGAHIEHVAITGYPSTLLGFWVRERKALSIERAINILTGLPAEALGIFDRGSLAEGKYADLVVFDPDRIATHPQEPINDLPGGGTRMIQRNEGVCLTVVNGTVVMDSGEHTGAFPGRVLRDLGKLAP